MRQSQRNASFWLGAAFGAAFGVLVGTIAGMSFYLGERRAMQRVIHQQQRTIRDLRESVANANTNIANNFRAIVRRKN